MKVRFSSIKWDTDGEDQKELSLPEDCILEVPEGTDVEEDGADILSDKFGYCVFSFDFSVQTEFVAVLRVNVELNGVFPNEIKAAIRDGITEMFGNGAVTGESEAEVESWDLDIKQVQAVTKGAQE